MDTQGNMALIQKVLSEEKMKFVVVDTKRQLDLIQDELKAIMSSAGFALSGVSFLVYVLQRSISCLYTVVTA